MMKNQVIKSVLCAGMAMAVSACQMSGNDAPLADQQEVTFDDMPISAVSSLDSALINHDWLLIAAVNKQNENIDELIKLKEPASLNFGKSAASFDVGCNSMNADYQLTHNTLITGMIISTEMYCADLDLAEKALGNLMTGESKLAINGNKLVQTTANGSKLTWQGTLKNEAKYGEGQTIFLEVAPKTQQCVNDNNQQCLKVREVYYDDNWIKSGFGEWQLFDKQIEGFSHEAGIRKVLRVKKYVTNPTDVKGKQPIYVLDMAVESELIPR